MKTFTRRQQLNIELGGAKRRRLVEQAEKAAGASLNSKFPHTYIYSPPGLGKTFSVERAVKETGIDYEVISGNQSMFAFGVKLAVINHIVPKDKPFVIIVDDCDEILKNEQNVNIMKNVLSGHRVYQYEKSLQSQWSNLSEPQQEAITAHSSDQQMGFIVPMERFVFIFTSNFKLPTDDEVQDARERGLQRANMKAHLNAIRSRCKPADFDLTKDEQWGWIADVIMNENCIDLSEDDKMALLDWMDNNWIE